MECLSSGFRTIYNVRYNVRYCKIPAVCSNLLQLLLHGSQSRSSYSAVRERGGMRAIGYL